MNDFKPCILIPVYNHEHAIGAVLDALRPFDLPCLLIDDGSNAACRHTLSTLATEQADWLQVQHLPHNLGKGGAVMAGLRWAKQLGYSHAIQIDADGQHHTPDILQFIHAAQTQPNALIAGRPIYDASVPKGRLYGRYATHIWVWINTLSLQIQDAMCGFRVYPLAASCALIERESLGRRMEFDIEVMVRLFWADVPIVQLATPVQYPLDGVSHFALWRDNLLISRLHAKLFLGMLWRSPRLISRWFRA
ncbi:glycosyltransferase family 2 protein [uncultured Deefgea sp.]|uniref:glycosyltransferase family 2 protein n=1 Tax=uncultured Deefgea sp. TaxID=1304914 RepID=UPI00259A8408|nr:glycosyltransferase family 2 protein [uncultured Deefgea sp.]